MFSNDFVILFGICWLIALSLTIAILWDRKKPQPAFLKGQANSLKTVQPIERNYLPALIDRPLLELSDGAEITIDKELESEPHFVAVDDEESFLLKAAEIVVEKIQDVLNNIASNPPNPEEVISKIKAIVNPYTIFKDTEYFDAINSFIAVSVERDCSIFLTKDQVLNLWS